MNTRSLICGAALTVVAIGLVGCATPHDYNIDVDALLRQLEFEESGGAARPVADSSVARSVADQPLPLPLPAPLAPMAEGELTIQPDCLVQISVEEDPALNSTYPVNEIGAVKLGYVGPVILYNKTEAQAAAKIRDILTSRHFRNATVQVRIIRASYDKVRIAGEVFSSGDIKIGAGDTISLNDALLRVGGLKPSARGASVKIVRNGLLDALAMGKPGEVYPLSDSEGRPFVPNVHLRNNDFALVFHQAAEADGGGSIGGEKTILVLGEIKRPGVYRFSPGEPCTVMHLMFRLSGQFSPYSNKKKVKIVRSSGGFENEMQVDIEDLLREGDLDGNVALEDGDRIIIPQRRMSLF